MRRTGYELAVLTDDKEKPARMLGREHQVHTTLAPRRAMVIETTSQAPARYHGMTFWAA